MLTYQKVFVGAFLVLATVTLARTRVAAAQEVPLDAARWEIRAAESRIEQHLGRSSLYLKGGQAVVKDSNFTDGVIDFDMAFTGERGFMGAFWRQVDPENHEEFYVRPHQSGNPDANQYTPNFNGIPAWQLYYGEGYGAPVRYANNTWIPVRIVVAGTRAEIYIGDMSKPALYVSEMKQPVRAGRVGLNVGNFAPAWFSRFRFTALAQPPVLVNPPRAPVTAPAGTVMAWQVSDTFDEKSLEARYQLIAADLAGRTWTKLECESTGMANLARLQGVAARKDTVFARLTITSEGEQVKRVRFGFSDRVKVYVNRRLVYGGNDNYQSRDYRFLGTVGLFDELYLPLQKGDNELWFAVSESFGGWGIKAQFDDPAGITWR